VYTPFSCFRAIFLVWDLYLAFSGSSYFTRSRSRDHSLIRKTWDCTNNPGTQGRWAIMP
jgi:hypothetical protein